MINGREEVASVFIKTLTVIDSCENVQQLTTAHKYLSKAYLGRFISGDDYDVLTGHLYEIMPRLYRVTESDG